MHSITLLLAHRSSAHRTRAHRLAVGLNTCRGLLFACAALLVNSAWSATLTIDIKNVVSAQGTLHVEIMNKAAYKTSSYQTTRPDVTVYAKLFPMATPTMQVVVPDVPAGRYAVRVYQDLDEDGRFDMNFLGWPREPYGFSNDAHAWFGKPSFGKAAIAVAEPETHLAIRLRH